MKKLLLIILPLFLATSIYSQRGWEAGGWLGVSYYFGDLNTSYNLSRPGIAGGAIARYNFNERICFKIGAGYGSVGAYDSDSRNAYERARNLSFQSTLMEGTFQFEFNFLPYVHGSKDEFYTPYLFAGVSAFHFNPKAELDGEIYQLRELGTEGQFKGEEYFGVAGAWAYGIGFKVDLSYEWSLNFELSARSTFTDYIDDVSTVYPDKSDLQRLRGDVAVALSDRSIIIPGVNEGQIGETGFQRGNSTTNDAIVYLSAGLVYFFGDLRCPEPGAISKSKKK